ncbi:MAG: MFS transporter [Deltaproteobacteria bacterium]|nr:MFS transporter [Deltaproteobacteria bacterium]
MSSDLTSANPDENPDPFKLHKKNLLNRFNALKPLQYIDCRWLMIANFASFMAIGMQQLTRAWLILRLTNDSPLALTFVTMAFALPMTIVALLGGALADRVPKRSLMLLSQAVTFFMILLLATLDYSGLIRFWHLIVIGIINGTTVAASMPSRQSIISDIVPENTVMSAIALSNSVNNSTRIIGPSLAGFLIVFIGTAGVFYLIAIVQLIAFFFTYMLKTGKLATGKSNKGFAGDIIEGFRYAKTNPVMLGLILLSLVPAIFGFPYITLLPAWAREALDAKSLGMGWLEAVMGSGSLIGALILASMGHIKHRGVFLIINGFAWGLALLMFSRCGSYYTAFPGIFIVGFMSSIFMSLNNTLMQIKSSDEMRGRMVSLSMMTFGIMPLSAVPFGILAEHIGTPHSLTVAGSLLCVFIIFFYIFSRNFRKVSQ